MESKITRDKQKQEDEVKDANSLNNYDIIFSKEDSYLKTFMDKDTWEECKDLSCHEGVPFRTCVYPGIKFHDNKTWGLCASSMSAYKIYHKVFDKYLRSEHQFYRDGGKYIEIFPNI